MFSATSRLKRIMLILSPCAALSSYDVYADKANMHASAQHHQDLIDNKKTGVVMIGKDSCGHCRAASPVFEEISLLPEYEGVAFIKLDRESADGDALMNKHSFDGVPAFIFIKEGEVVGTDMGFESKEALHDTIKKHVSGNQSEVSASVDALAPVQEAPVEEEGVLAKLKGLFVGLFETIKNIFVTIFDWIIGLFRK